MNKTIKKILWVMALILMPMSFVACSDDDDDDETDNELIGTWKYTVTSDEDDEDQETGYFTFKSDGSLTWDDGEEVSSNCHYTLSGTTLKMVFNDDDYTLGTIAIDGTTAVYTYSWYDVDGEWGGEDVEVMTLQKQ